MIEPGLFGRCKWRAVGICGGEVGPFLDWLKRDTVGEIAGTKFPCALGRVGEGGRTGIDGTSAEVITLLGTFREREETREPDLPVGAR